MSEREPRWWSHSINEKHRSTADERRYLLYRRWWGTLRRRPNILRCSLLGHRPVVDGTHGVESGGRVLSPGSRWVCCSRCGRRTYPSVPLPKDAPLGSRVRGLDGMTWADRSIKVHYEIAMPRRWWRDWTIGAEIRLGGEDGTTLALHFLIGTVWLSIDGVLGGLMSRIDYRWEPRIGFRVYRFDGTTCVTWDLMHDDIHNCKPEHRLGERAPWWRHGYFHVGDKILGRMCSERRVVDTATGMIALPEAHYPAVLTLEEFTRWRSRLPWRRQVHYRCDVKPERPVPVPGNTESDFYDGEDATHSMSVGCPHGPDEPLWVAHALSEFVAGVLRDRTRHGGSAAWVPEAYRAG